MDARYDIDITEAGQGRFRAVCRSTGLETISANAEHDICHLLTQAGHPDGPVQFWRGATPSLSHRSIYRMGRHRIELGDNFPRRVKRRLASPEIFSESVAGSTRNRDPLVRHAQHCATNSTGRRI
jgi:hypothetical protein